MMTLTNPYSREDDTVDIAWTKEQKLAYYKQRNRTAPKGGILFAGSSLMEMFPVERFAAEEGIAVINRGVGGFVTQELLDNMDTCILELRPSKLFINIGTNDLSHDDWSLAEVMARYEAIITRVREALPDTAIWMMAYYPVNRDAAPEEMKPVLDIRSNAKIDRANAEVAKLAAKRGCRYIDINAPLKDEKGNLKAEYTYEGIHIQEEGYRAIFPLLLPYIRS